MMDHFSTLHRRTLLKATAGLGAAFAMPGGTLAAPAEGEGIEAGAGPWVYWYWLDANITREGIIADLDAMYGAGIAGAIIFNIGGVSEATLIAPPVESHSPQWWEMVRLATMHARDRGITIGMNMCDGWGTAGGAWVTPEKSAQQIVWTVSHLSHDAGATSLPQPLARENYYRDVASFAFPVPDAWHDGGSRCTGVLTSWAIDQPDRLRNTGQPDNVIDTQEAGWIQYSFDRPFALASVTIRSQSVAILPFLSLGYSTAANSLIVQASDDGQSFHTVHRLRAPQLGWQANLVELDHAIPPVRARYFRFVHDPQSVPVSSGHDGRMAASQTLQLASLTLSAQPVVDCRQVRSGEAWGFADPITEAMLPSRHCVAISDIIDISDQVSPSGACRWRPSDKRRWMVVRVGATTNGKTTSPSGRMGGLECDKFDPQAVAMQFDRWFGEAIRRVGPSLSPQILKTLHMDSWEGRGQNWSPRLLEAFKERRGYDVGPLLLVLVGIPVNDALTVDGFLTDWRRTIGELLPESFFGTIARLAHQHDCLFSSEPANASFPSDGLAIFRDVDLPCGEFWHARHNSDKPSDVMEAASAAQVYGKQIVGAEAWTGGLDWSEHPFSFKRQGDENFCLGVNRMILHVWAHQAFPDRKPGITLFGLGAFFSPSQTWWPMAGAWIGYLSRCQHWLQQGRMVADLCYFMGEDIPARAYVKDNLEPAPPPGHAFTSLNADALWTLASVKDGRIILPSGASYAMLVIPPDLTISHRTAVKLNQLVAEGATLFGPKPRPLSSLQERTKLEETLRIIDILWPASNASSSQVKVHQTGDLAHILGDLGLAPAIEGVVPELRWTHRITPERDVFFLSNQSDNSLDLDLHLRTTGRQIRMIDPVDGREHLLPSRQARLDGTAVRLSLGPVASVILMADHRDTSPLVASTAADISALVISPDRQGAFVDVTASGHWTLSTGGGRSHSVRVDALPPHHILGGPWDIRFDNQPRSHMKQVTALRSWTQETDDAIRFHSGTASYVTCFKHRSLKGLRWLLSIEQCANIAEVTVNGRTMGTMWIPGRPLDISEALVDGRNRLSIKVANSWRNRLIGDRRASQPQTWILQNRLGRSAPQSFTGDEPLLPAGLMGEIKLIPVARRKLEDANLARLP
ncbi:glycosyl hydrolase [Sphingobium sp. CR2-8]|uniref:glycosyl hydrolase n=1 Tax=Sphingobium sp. CR2-8 TaxID=1306534 RepID=UPI002DBD323A|nr:glycosyl hydrolase [Sphingobium sp. CR2-8]MEC3909157.1 glycosyl hydrolase [Sphingobium sp. CR2-8]